MCIFSIREVFLWFPLYSIKKKHMASLLLFTINRGQWHWLVHVTMPIFSNLTNWLWKQITSIADAKYVASLSVISFPVNKKVITYKYIEILTSASSYDIHKIWFWLITYLPSLVFWVHYWFEAFWPYGMTPKTLICYLLKTAKYHNKFLTFKHAFC